MADPLPIKVLRFRLIGPNTRPLSFAFISAQIVPILTNSRNSNTVFPVSADTRTNEYGIAELKLYANDVLQTDSKYMITITFNGKSYRFLVKLLQSMDDIVHFEDLLNREAINKLAECENQVEGEYKISGSKYYY